MSSYFDSFDKQVRELSRTCAKVGDSPEQKKGRFVIALEELESHMIRDCELFAGDVETPESVRQCVIAVISLAAVKNSTRAREDALICYLSTLSRDMHGLFHDIARMRYQMRYGMVFDDPEAAVQARDRFVEERERKKLPHPWQKTGGKPNHPVLALNDAPPYCRKVLGRLG